jgi:hypothetical protein
LGFAVSTIPFEANTGYVSSVTFSYAIFSEWFNKVKDTFANEGNFSELKSDRLEAIIDSGSSFAIITFSESGFGHSKGVTLRLKADNGESSRVELYPLPERGEDESIDDLTIRWLQGAHDDIKSVLTSMRVRARWFDFPFNSESVSNSPPDLFPPTT